MSGNVVQQSCHEVRRDALLAQLTEDDQGLGLDPDTALVVQLLDPKLVGVQKTLENYLGLFVHQDSSLGCAFKTKKNIISLFSLLQLCDDGQLYSSRYFSMISQSVFFAK